MIYNNHGILRFIYDKKATILNGTVAFSSKVEIW